MRNLNIRLKIIEQRPGNIQQITYYQLSVYLTCWCCHHICLINWALFPALNPLQKRIILSHFTYHLFCSHDNIDHLSFISFFAIKIRMFQNYMFIIIINLSYVRYLLSIINESRFVSEKPYSSAKNFFFSINRKSPIYRCEQIISNNYEKSFINRKSFHINLRRSANLLGFMRD